MYEAGRRIRGEPLTGARLAGPVLDAGAVLRHLLRGWGLILLCGLLGAAAAAGGLALVTPQYTSQVEVYVDPTALHIVADDMADRKPPTDSGALLLETKARVMRSDGVLRRVVGDLGLARDPYFLRLGWGDDWAARFADLTGIGPARAEPEEIALDNLKRVVTVRRRDQVLVIDIYVETPDPALSARVAGAVSDAFREAEAADRLGTARRITGSFDAALEDLKAGVEAAEARVVRYRRDNGLFSADGTPLGDQQLAALNRQIVAAEIRTAEARARLAQARRAGADDGAALPEMLESRELRGLRQQRSALSRTIAELTARLGARHPALLEQAAKERELDRLIRREKARIVDGLQQEADRAVAGEAAIRAGFEAAKSEVTGNERAEVGLRELERERDARRSVYEAYLRRAGEIGAQGRIDSARIRVISPAVPAVQPSWPPARKPVLIQAFAMGALVGAILALLRGMRADRARLAAALGFLPEAPAGRVRGAARP